MIEYAFSSVAEIVPRKGTARSVGEVISGVAGLATSAVELSVSGAARDAASFSAATTVVAQNATAAMHARILSDLCFMGGVFCFERVKDHVVLTGGDALFLSLLTKRQHRRNP